MITLFVIPWLFLAMRARIREETLAEYRMMAVRKLPSVDAEKDLEWICRTFGFLEPRDKKRQPTAYLEPSSKPQDSMKVCRATKWPTNSL